MQKKVFKKNYSRIYDFIYSKKKYSEEIDKILLSLKKYKNIDNIQILDIGCGTGGHLIELLKKGFNVYGIDNSKDMINLAKEKLENKKIDSSILQHMDAENLNNLNQKFDVVIILFNVIGYLKDLEKFFFNIKEKLNDEAILIFDFWYGPSVIKNKPKSSYKRFSYNDLKIIKKSKGEIIDNRKIKVDIDFFVDENGSILKDHETHYVNFFFPDYFSQIFTKLGFTILEIDNKKYTKFFNSDTKWEAICYIQNN